jgi:hemerythrin superfamily protein
LLKHLNKEDEQLYPVLRKKAEKNEHLKNALDLCVIDMENVSRVVQEFFDKYSRGVSGKELQKEFENLFVALDKRVRNEEDILYDEYE